MARREMDPERLLEGPRGRRVCWALLAREGAWWWRQRAPESAGPRRLADELAGLVDRAEVGAIADTGDPVAFWDALEDTVYAAAYWQEPDACDRRLAHPDVSATLRPVAEALMSAAAAGWWGTPMDPTAQFEVSFELPEPSDAPVRSRDPVSALADWRTVTLAEERRAEKRRDDPSASFSGSWWSAPARSGLLQSTRALGARGPVGLTLIEDVADWTSAQARQVDVRPGASIFEIGAPDDWIALVDRYPLVVSRSRRHDWWRATGEDARWAIPDYQAVAADFDGIHVSVMGYLSTAGRPLRAGALSTVLAGWGPDTTWWLTESAGPAGPAAYWRLDRENRPLGWARHSE